MSELSGLVPFLVHLHWDMDKPPNPDVLFKMSENLLDREEMAFLSKANISGLDAGSTNKTIAQIAAFDLRLRSDYYLLKKGADEKPQYLPSDFLVERDPFTAEVAILKMLWMFLDSLKMTVNGVTVDTLIIHTLQSQILWRIHSFDDQKGRNIFTESTAFDSKMEVA